MKLEKKLYDSHGDVIIRVMTDIETREKKDGTAIAEIVTQGCVIGFYTLRLVDKIQWLSELNEVHDRLTSVKLDEGNLEEVLYWGRKIADTVLDFHFDEDIMET